MSLIFLGNMFWNKKEVVETDGLPITLSKRQAFNRYTGAITSHFLAYKNGNEWRGLVGYEQFKEEMDETRKKQELILDHLKLKYVPETETKEPAKLVEKTTPTIVGSETFLTCGGGSGGSSSHSTSGRVKSQELMALEILLGANTQFTETSLTPKPKKKRGRPKKK